MTEVLIVDDDRDFCEILREFFVMLGLECVVVHSIAELQRLAAIPQDLAVLDINLGLNEPSGVAVHLWLEAQGFVGKVVYLTGHARSSPVVREALERPNVKLLTKPVSIEQLESLVQ